MERCLVATSIAILLCHPSSTIKCFNPKPKGTKPTPSSPKKKTKPLPPMSPTPPSTPPESKPIKPEYKRQSRKKAEARSTPKESLAQSKTRQLDANVIMKRTPSESFSFRVAESILRRQGWDPQARMVIEGIWKVKHKDLVIKRFEKYREAVKENSLKIEGCKGGKGKISADGNEILCFRGASVFCDRGSDSQEGICNGRSCGVCRLMRIIGRTSDSSEKDSYRPMLLSLNSWRAHQKAAKKCENNDDGRQNKKGRKAIVICRVIAGCVASFTKENEEFDGFDSALLSTGDNDSDQELLVLNPNAVLPCFVVIYNIT